MLYNWFKRKCEEHTRLQIKTTEINMKMEAKTVLHNVGNRGLIESLAGQNLQVDPLQSCEKAPMETQSYKAEGCATDKSFRFPISHHFFWAAFP